MEWSFIKISFGDSIQQWVSTFYNNWESTVLNNGFCTALEACTAIKPEAQPLATYETNMAAGNTDDLTKT